MRKRGRKKKRSENLRRKRKFNYEAGYNDEALNFRVLARYLTMAFFTYLTVQIYEYMIVALNFAHAEHFLAFFCVPNILTRSRISAPPWRGRLFIGLRLDNVAASAAAEKF